MADGRRHPINESFYFEDIVFLVDGMLFKVHRRDFELGSEVFEGMFKAPPEVGKPVEGSSPDHPLQLDGIKRDDFVQLLKVMYPTPSTEISLTRDEWISVLKLSTMWQFNVIRNQAIDSLQHLPPRRRVALAQEFNISEWLLPALKELAEQKEPIGVKDVEEIGLDFALKLAHVRYDAYAAALKKVQTQNPFELSRRNGWGIGVPNQPYNPLIGFPDASPKPSPGEPDFTASIKKVFGL